MSIQKTPEKNSILFVWFNNYAGILLKTPTKTLAIDPVDVKPKTLKNVDAILITHEHYDHLDPPLISEIQKATGCTIIADSASTKKLKLAIPNDKLRRHMIRHPIFLPLSNPSQNPDNPRAHEVTTGAEILAQRRRASRPNAISPLSAAS